MRHLIFAGTAALALTLGPAAIAGQSTMAPNAGSATKTDQSATAQNQGEPRGEVKDVQQKLKSENLYKGNIDGILGPETQQALKDYQKKNNLQQTGRLDDQTEQKLGIAEQSGSSTAPATKQH